MTASVVQNVALPRLAASKAHRGGCRLCVTLLHTYIAAIIPVQDKSVLARVNSTDSILSALIRIE